MNSSARKRRLRERIELGEYTPKTGPILPLERVGLKNSKGFHKSLMVAIVSDRQRGLRGCTIVVGESSLHANQQPTLAHEPTPERVAGVSLLTRERGDSHTTVYAPADLKTPWRPLSSDTVPDNF